MNGARLVMLGLLLGCGGGAGQGSSAEPEAAEVPGGAGEPEAVIQAPDAPRLGRDVIRAALPEGATWEMKGLRDDGREVLHRFEVVRLSAREVHIERSLVDAFGGVIGEPATEILRLAVLQDAEGIHQRQGRYLGVTAIDLPSGMVEARGYEVERPSPEGATRVRQWFTEAFPGRAVRYEVWRGDARVGGAELLRERRR